MAEKSEHHEESLLDKLAEKFHGGDSSSDSEVEKEKEKVKEKEKEKSYESPSSSSSMKTKIFRLFGRENPVHKVLGGGKPADIFLWRNKKVSAGVLGTVTAVWVLFELAEYHLLTLVCHLLILALALLFLWSNASKFINKSTPNLPEVIIPEDLALQVASAFRIEINRGFAILRDIASGKDLKQFLSVIAGLWVVSIIGNWCNFLTLFYIAFVLLHTVPVFYEKYDDKVDAYAEKAMFHIKKQYAVFDAKVLSQVMSKIPRGLKKD